MPNEKSQTQKNATYHIISLVLHSKKAKTLGIENRLIVAQKYQ